MKRKSMGSLMVMNVLIGINQRWKLFMGILFLLLLSGVESHAQKFPDQQIIGLKTNGYGMVYESTIQLVSGTKPILKIPNTGLRQEFSNLKNLIEWMALYGYRLTMAIPMNTNIDEKYVHTQYVFEKTAGTYPLFPLK